MNGLTLELFQNISENSELEDTGREQILAWLSALLQIPYMEPKEKENALILVDFLEEIPGGEVFAPLYRAVRTKLRFADEKPWNMDWPDNYQVSVNGEALMVDDLRRRGIEHVDFRLTKPIRNSMEYITVRRLHSDGTVEILPEYQVFDASPVGERHLFNVYGEKAVTDKKQRRD